MYLISSLINKKRWIIILNHLKKSTLIIIFLNYVEYTFFTQELYCVRIKLISDCVNTSSIFRISYDTDMSDIYIYHMYDSDLGEIKNVNYNVQCSHMIHVNCEVKAKVWMKKDGPPVWVKS